MFASDEPDIKNSLDVLFRWCNEWGVEINVHKSGIMHIRQKKMKRADVQYVIDMAEKKTVAGKKTLGVRFSQCKLKLGDVGVETFRKQMSSPVESTMLYDAEIWVCNRSLQRVEQIQLESPANVLLSWNIAFQNFSFGRDVGLTSKMAGYAAVCVVWVRILLSRAYDKEVAIRSQL